VFVDNAELDGAHHRRAHRMHSELAVDLLDVARDGVSRKAKPLGARGIGIAAGDEAQHVDFARA
jgi:hypothetical protein